MKKLNKTEQAKKEAFKAIMNKHDIHNCSVDQLFSALYTEFRINDNELLLNDKEKEVVSQDAETGIWEDTDENREVLVGYYEYAAEYTTNWDARN